MRVGGRFLYNIYMPKRFIEIFEDEKHGGSISISVTDNKDIIKYLNKQCNKNIKAMYFGHPIDENGCIDRSKYVAWFEKNKEKK